MRRRGDRERKMAEIMFKTIHEHWAHFLERDMPTDAPAEQVMAMKLAFAAGAISGLALAVVVGRERDPAKCEALYAKHIEDIKDLGTING